MFPKSLVLIGCGKMGGALLAGWLRDGLDGGGVTIVEPHPAGEITALADQHAATVIAGPDRCRDAPPEVLVLAIKPQMMDEVLPTIGHLVGPETLVVSVAAGTSVSRFNAAFGADAGIVRVMPNTPSAVGRGMSVGFASTHVSSQQRAVAEQLMTSVGAVAWIDEESAMDAVTGVSGSGPAYVFHMVECLAAAGVAAGLEPGLADQLARQTVAGAGELLYRAEDSPATLRKNVTSPNGTTAAGLAVLMGGEDGKDGLRPLIEATVAAAARRSRELDS